MQFSNKTDALLSDRHLKFGSCCILKHFTSGFSIPFLHRKKPAVTQLSTKKRQLTLQKQMLAQCSVPVARTGKTPFPVHLCARGSIRCAMQLKVHNHWNAASSFVPCFVLIGPKLTHVLHSFHICFALNTSQKHLNTEREFWIKFQMVSTRRWSYTALGVSCRKKMLFTAFYQSCYKDSH